MKKVFLFLAFMLFTLAMSAVHGGPTSASTTTEPEPEFTVVIDTMEPDSTVVDTTVTPGPLVVCPPEARFPQSYEADAPCGPVDPCIVQNEATGEGYTLWHVHGCSVPVDIVSTGQALPATGTTTIVLAVLGMIVILIGIIAVVGSRRSTSVK